MHDLHQNVIENLEEIGRRMGIAGKFSVFQTRDNPDDFLVDAFFGQYINHLYAVLTQDPDFLPGGTLHYDQNRPDQLILRSQGNLAQLSAGIYDVLESTTAVITPTTTPYPTPSKSTRQDQLKERIWKDVARIAEEGFRIHTFAPWQEDELDKDGTPTGKKFDRSPNPDFLTAYDKKTRSRHHDTSLTLHGPDSKIRPMAQLLNHNNITTHYGPPTIGTNEGVLSIDLRSEGLDAVYAKVSTLKEKFFNLKPEPGAVDPNGTTSPGMPASVPGPKQVK